MCKFCDEDYTQLTIPMRTSFADDNVCDLLSPDGSGYTHDCNGCYGCADENNFFKLYFHRCDGSENIISLSYYHKVREGIIAPISARFEFSYCPFCGRKISDNDIDAGNINFW